jgi:hypothetical protein
VPFCNTTQFSSYIFQLKSVVLLPLPPLLLSPVFAAAGGSVPVVYSFDPDKGNATSAVAKILAGKAAAKNPVDAVFIATTDLVFVAGGHVCCT